MKCLVTGGEGFIGYRLVSKLREQGNKVDTFDLKSGQDIRTDELKGNYDIIYHLAALRSVPKSFENPRDYFDTNAYGSYRIFEAFPKTKIINISTSSASNPIAPYGLSKLFAEIIAEKYNNVVSLRLFCPFGENQQQDTVIPTFAKAMIKNEPVYIHSDGEQSRDFTYIEDVVDEIIINWGDKKIFEVGYGYSISVNDIFDTMAEFFNYKQLPIYRLKRIGDQEHTCASDEMTITPIGFDEGLLRTMKWYKENI